MLKQLNVNLSLPDFTEDLQKADEASKQVLIKFTELKNNHYIFNLSHEDLINNKDNPSLLLINNYWHDKLYEDNARILTFVGSLTKQIFNTLSKLEKAYLKEYKSKPQQAKSLYLKHYESLHNPFDIIKNRCWRIFDNLDIEYKSLYNFPPPNWDFRLYNNSPDIDVIDGEEDDINNLKDDFIIPSQDDIKPKRKYTRKTNDNLNQPPMEDIITTSDDIITTSDDIIIDLILDDELNIIPSHFNEDF